MAKKILKRKRIEEGEKTVSRFVLYIVTLILKAYVKFALKANVKCECLKT